VNSPPDDSFPPLEAYATQELAPIRRPDWLGILSKSGKATDNNLDNAIRSIENDPELEGRIWYDEFLDAIVTNWQGPQRKWRDSDDILLQLYIQRHVGLKKISATTCHDAALVAAFRNIKNECREWLESLKGDETPRLDYLMSEGFGTAHNAYTAALGRCWILSIVARVMRPGCKVDTVPVLEGHQGAGKSSALAILGGKWFVECHESVLTKDFFGVLDGHMMVEISEMHSFNKSEIERVKGIISCQVDRYRRAYGRNTEDHPRQTVLVCTTNRNNWQNDPTGARRFLPALCGEINLEWLQINRELLFAEAVQLFASGAKWWDIPIDEQQRETDNRREGDPWEDAILDFLIGKREITIPKIMLDCLNFELSRNGQPEQRRIAAILEFNGWTRKVWKENGKTRRGWEFK
jgi:putative DNA primase/helicase